MRNLYLILVSAILLNCSNETIRKTDLDEMHIKGKVKSVKIFQYKAVKKNGKIKKEKIDNSGSSVSVNNQFDFNKKGMVTEQRKYISDRFSKKFTYVYDDDLNILSKDYYDNSGNLLAESKFENVHNSNGELIEEKEFMTGKNLDNNWTHKFFKNKNKVKKIDYSGEKSHEIREYFYDKNGNLIQENWNSPDGTIHMKTIMEYNDGNLKQTSILDSKDSLISNQYFEYLEFDHGNNWTKLLISENNKPESIIEVEIEYYE